MKAIITGASSGIGNDIAKYLSKLGYDLVVVARREDKLIELKNECSTNVEIVPMDLSIMDNAYKLYDMYKDEKIDILINNAGFGVFGEFTSTDLSKEMNMIDLNIKTMHSLTKLFLPNMIKENYGYILNVGSIAGYMPSGPLFSSYYASKAYVLHLTRAIQSELKKIRSNVKVSVLSPGPVNTEFNNVAKVSFSMKSLSSQYVAKYAIDNLLKGKKEIIPGNTTKVLPFLVRITPNRILNAVTYKIQKKKIM